MINVLPPEIKRDYRYARRNVGLRRWVAASVIAVFGLSIIMLYGLITLDRSAATYRKQVAANEAVFQNENFTAAQKEAQDISSSFKLTIQVLSKEVLFSQLLRQVGRIIPADANLTGLTISQTQGAIDISAVAKDYSSATQVQVNLADPENKIFSKADIVSINCNAKDSDSAYPCTVTIRALFSANNPYLLINNKAPKS
jgi:Tfp pilus assembly protein PilN